MKLRRLGKKQRIKMQYEFKAKSVKNNSSFTGSKL